MFFWYTDQLLNHIIRELLCVVVLGREKTLYVTLDVVSLGTYLSLICSSPK